MDKTIGKDIQNPLARQAFLKDNCDTVEEIAPDIAIIEI